MKKILAFCFFTLFALGTLNIFCYCSSSDDDELDGTFMVAYNQNLIGRWTYSRSSGTETLEFHKDGKGVYVYDYDNEEGVETEPFTWTYEERSSRVRVEQQVIYSAPAKTQKTSIRRASTEVDYYTVQDGYLEHYSRKYYKR